MLTRRRDGRQVLSCFALPLEWAKFSPLFLSPFYLSADGGGNEATVHDFLSSIERTRSGAPDADGDAFDDDHAEGGEGSDGDRQRRQQQHRQRSSRSRRAAAEVWIGLYQSSTAERFHWV